LVIVVNTLSFGDSTRMPGERFIVGNTQDFPEDDIDFGASCLDITGRTITGGNHYVPGPDSCTVCLCDGGRPKWCQAVLCAAPKDCKSFRIGSSCCEFICLDNSEGGRDEGSVDVSWGNGNWVGEDLGLRLIATAITAVLSLALLSFLFYRLRRRRMDRHNGCHELEVEDIHGSNSSMASLNDIHGDLTSTGHLSRQPPTALSTGEHQSPTYLTWKQPTAVLDAPPPYSETPNQPATENEQQETTGLLAVPLTAFTSESGEVVHLARRSNDTLNSDMLGAGTPPPSYAEVLAYISTETIDQPGAVFANPDGGEGNVEGDSSAEWRMSLNLPRERRRTSESAIQRFSLQLALDYSESSSCTSTLSHAQPLSTSSSSSALSMAPL